MRVRFGELRNTVSKFESLKLLYTENIGMNKMAVL